MSRLTGLMPAPAKALIALVVLWALMVAAVVAFGAVRGGSVTQTSLTIVPLSLVAANTFVAQYHRHHEPVIGHKFSIGVCDDDGGLRGAAIVGRPVSRRRDDGGTLEVTRLVTDGCENGCSALYAAAWRATKALGYTRLGTYILENEPGTSLKAAGWKCIGSTPGRSWDVPSRPRVDKHPLGQRQLWEAS